MTRKDKQRRQSLLKRLKKIGLNPAEEIISSRDYNEVVKSILEHMNNVGGYSSDQVREDIEAIVNLKSANDITFSEISNVSIIFLINLLSTSGLLPNLLCGVINLSFV